MTYKIKKECRCCKNRKLISYLDLGNQPLANSYHKGKKLSRAPLEVMLCEKCYHSQLSVVVKPEEMFDEYLYVSGTTQTFKKHTKELARDAVRRFKNKKLAVMDIACNDGTQLEFFKMLGCKVLGVDPARNLRQISKKKKVPVLVEYWNSRLADSFRMRFDIITATNVFAHVDDTDDFLNACKIVLSEDGILIIEFPYVFNMIKHNEFDTIYHEHLSYFSVNSFRSLVGRNNFTIVDILTTKIHGGSIRFFLKKNEAEETEKVDKLIKEEKKNGLHSLKTYRNFSLNVTKNKKDMLALSKRITKENKKIIGYGASAKGSTMLNYFKLKMDYTVDDNALKWGYMTPGMNIYIKNPMEMKKEKDNLYIVILAWNFYNEISKRISRIRKGKNDFAILYVPKVDIKKLKDTEKLKQSA